MISKETEAEVVRLFHAESWPIGTISAQLGLHHTTVQRVLQQSGVEPKTVAPRPSIIDPFVPFMLEQLAKYPSLRASRSAVSILAAHGVAGVRAGAGVSLAIGEFRARR